MAKVKRVRGRELLSARAQTSSAYTLRATSLLVIFAALALAPLAAAQSVKTVAEKTPLYKDAKSGSPVIAEVAAGTELEFEWDEALRVTLSRQVQSYSQAPDRRGAVTQSGLTEIRALIPSKEVDGQLWLRVRTANKEKAWVRHDAVKFDASVPVLVPVRAEQVPQLRRASMPRAHDQIVARLGRTTARVKLLLEIGPDGQTRGVHVVQSSGAEEVDAIVAGAAREFRFQPVLLNGQPAFALLVLEFGFSM